MNDSILKNIKKMQRINNASNPNIAILLDDAYENYKKSLQSSNITYFEFIEKCKSNLSAVHIMIVKRQTTINTAIDEPLLFVINTLANAIINQKRIEQKSCHKKTA